MVNFVFISISIYFLIWNLELDFSILLYIVTRYNGCYKLVTQLHDIGERCKRFWNNDAI